MVSLDHPSFRQPNNWNLKIWRYMDFVKFKALIETEKLFFCRSDLLDDTFEGSYPKENILQRSTVYNKIPEEIREKSLSTFSTFSNWFREWIYLNCWHANTLESDAMWKLYANTSESVVIVTEYKLLAHVLPEKAYLGMVNYSDYEKETIPEGIAFSPFMHKRKEFEHEREVRAVIMENLPKIDNSIQIGQRNALDGIAEKVDVGKLIKNVYISPLGTEEFLEHVKTTVQKLGFDFEVKKSALSSQPLY